MTREERLDRMRSACRTFTGWTPPPKEKPSRHGIGGNNPPRYDKDAEVTGFPNIMQVVQPVCLDGKTELTCRSQIREYERAHNVERIGLDYSASSDHDDKPWWWDEYKENRREREKAKRLGKKGPDLFLPANAPHAPKKVRNADL